MKNTNFDFDAIYKSYRRRVFIWCFRIARNTEDAEDLTQDTFLQLFRKIDTFRGESAFSTWLYRLTVNNALMRLRRKNLIQISLEDLSETGPGAAKSRPELQAPDRTMDASIARMDLGRALRGVPEGFRKVFILHDAVGYTHREIAEISKCAVGTSKSQLSKARRRLRERLRDRRQCL